MDACRYAAKTTVLEQPLDFSTLAPKYSVFVTDFINANHASPFFLYMPFSHVHTRAANSGGGRGAARPPGLTIP